MYSDGAVGAACAMAVVILLVLGGLVGWVNGVGYGINQERCRQECAPAKVFSASYAECWCSISSTQREMKRVAHEVQQ